MRIIPRSEWAGDIRPNGTPQGIVTPTPRVWLHHGASGSSTLATARSYVRFHTDRRDGRGWLDVGYSFLIAGGRVLEGRGAGRSGAHTNGDNTQSHGICMVGNYEHTPPQPRDLDALVWLLRHGAQRGWWRSVRLAGGHKDSPGGKATGTLCPGRALHSRIPSINARAATRDPETLEEWLSMASDKERAAFAREVAAEVAKFETAHTLDVGGGEKRPFGSVMFMLRTIVRLCFSILEELRGHDRAVRVLHDE